MKVYIKTEEMAGEKPFIIAFYPDDAIVPDNAHGEGVTVVSVPMGAIKLPLPDSPDAQAGFSMPHLAPNWRELAGAAPVQAEAKRRIESAFPLSDQLSSLYDMVDAITKHGPDISRWPADVRQRKTAFDEKWKYVADVKAKAHEQGATVARDPSNDKLWPRRPIKN